MTVVGLVYLAVSVNLAVRGGDGGDDVLYLFAYTPLKLRTALCTIVGRRARRGPAPHRMGRRAG